jgi:hypothetical protein
MALVAMMALTMVLLVQMTTRPRSWHIWTALTRRLAG